MKNLFKALIFLSTCLPIFAAAPFEYAPVYTNMTLQPIVGTGNRITTLTGGSTVTNLYTGDARGFGGFFIWDTNGTIASVDGTNVLDRRIASPVNETHTPGAGTLATATYYYRVSALTTNPLGETVPSAETSLAITGPAGVNVNWTQIPGATGYKVYGRATGAELFIAQVGKVGTYLDSGSITPSGAMPSTNSTMGVQGTYSRLFERIFGRAGPEGGDLTNDFPNPVLVPVITAAGPIGSATTTPVITFDAKGRLTTVTSAAISGVPPSGAAGGDLSGTYPNPTVDRLDGATVPAAGALTTGNVLQVNGVSSLTYGPVQLGGGANYVQGTVQVENGGTEFVTATPNGVLYGNGTGAIQVTAQGAANTVLVANAGAPAFSAAITVGTSVTTPALIATTSLTTPAATISGLTAARFAIVDTGGLIATDADFTWATDTASFTKVLAPTSVSTPSLISTAAITATPAAGNNFNINLSTTGDFAVNTSQLYVDTSTSFVGIGTATPLEELDVNGSIILPGATATSMARPAVGTSRVTGEISGYLTSNLSSDSGFLRLSAGGGSTANQKSFIDLAGFSSNGDMVKTIVFGTSGAEQARFNSTGFVFSNGQLSVTTATAPQVFVSNTSANGGGTLRLGGTDVSPTTGDKFGTLEFYTMDGDGAHVGASIVAVAEETFGRNTGLYFTTQATSGALTEQMRISNAGNVGIGTATPLAKLAVNGGANFGADADPGDNNINVVGLTTTGTLVVTTSSTHSYATASTVAVFDGSKNLVSSAVTTTTLSYLDATSSVQTQLNARTREPKYAAGDPNFLGTTGDDDGQMFMNTDTGEKWHWYAAGAYWTP